METQNNTNNKEKQHYLINKKVFATIDEANAYYNEFLKKTGIILGIEYTKRKPTHCYPLNDLKGGLK